MKSAETGGPDSLVRVVWVPTAHVSDKFAFVRVASGSDSCEMRRVCLRVAARPVKLSRSGQVILGQPRFEFIKRQERRAFVEQIGFHR